MESYLFAVYYEKFCQSLKYDSQNLFSILRYSVFPLTILFSLLDSEGITV